MEPLDEGAFYAIELRMCNGVPIVCLAGELDIAAEADLRATLEKAAKAGAPRVIIDLRETTFIEATAVNILSACHEAGAKLAVRGAHGLSRRVLEIVEAFAWMDVIE